ncbi:MAG: tetratricopeptide repeat protein [Deltaproteobacteria bacterium]|nr:tetratricopeptide repeat protein [Deltaproteobacteria bacterium]
MSQKKTASLIDSIQSEVSKEASPFLDFLILNSKKLIAAAVVLAVAAIGYGSWSVYQAEQFGDAREALGMILAQPDSDERFDSLKKFSAAAHAGVKPAALLALAQGAEDRGDYTLAAASWAEVAALTGDPMRATARMAEANAMEKQGKKEEALELLNGLTRDMPQEFTPALQSDISELAEELGKLDVAIAACESMLAAAEPNTDKTYWQQRLTYLRAKQGALNQGDWR